MAKYKRQKDGRYHTTITVGHDSDGRTVRKTIAAKTVAELEAKKQEVIQHYIVGGRANAEVFFDEFAADWFEDFKRQNTGAHNAQTYCDVLNARLLPKFEHRQLRAISANDLQQYLNWMSDTGYSRSYITKSKVIMSQIFGHARVQGIIDVNPMDVVEMPSFRARKEDKNKRRPLTADETERLLEVGSTDPDGLIILALYYLGVRPEECRGIRGSSIDLRRAEVTINWSVDYIAGRVSEDHSLKTQASYRTLPAPPPLMDVLRKHPCIGDAYLLPAPKDQAAPLPYSTYRRRWDRLMALAGTPYITPYWFRHNYISMMVDSGMPPHKLKQLTGHSDIRVLINTYYHQTETGKSEIRGHVDDVFSIGRAKLL